MSACLIDRFFAEEFDDYVRVRIEEEAAIGSGLRYLTFNVFNVALNLDEQSVTVEDEMDASSECTVGLGPFLERVRRSDPSI